MVDFSKWLKERKIWVHRDQETRESLMAFVEVIANLRCREIAEWYAIDTIFRKTIRG